MDFRFDHIRAGLICLIVGACTPSILKASPQPVQFQYQNNTECASSPIIQRKVAARLGYDPFERSTDKILAIEITKTPQGRYRASILTKYRSREDAGNRTLTARQCSELVDALVFAVSMAIDPSAAFGTETSDTDRTEKISSVLPFTRQNIYLANAEAKAKILEINNQANRAESSADASTFRRFEAFGGLGPSFGRTPNATAFVELGI